MPKPSEVDAQIEAAQAAAFELANDPLLACLAHIASSEGLPFAHKAVLAGLPLSPGERLGVTLIGRAAAQIGCKSEVLDRPPSTLPALLVPFIVAMADGEAAVVSALDAPTQTALIVTPSLSKSARRVRLSDLDAQAQHVVLVTRDELASAPSGADAASARHWLWAPMAALWPSWLQVAIAALLINVLGLAVPIFVMSVYDRVIPNQSQPTLWALTVGVLLALLFELALKQLRATVLDQAGGLVDLTASARLFRQVLALPLAARRLSPGEMAAQVREFETVREFFASSTIAAFTDLLFVGIVAIVLYALVGSLALVAVLALPVVLGLTLLLQWPLSRAVRATQAEGGRRHAILIESLAAIETVKAITAEGLLQKRWEHAVAATVRSSSATRLWSALNFNLIALVQQLVGVIVVVWGVFLSMDGLVTVGGIIAASMLSGRLLGPISSIAMVAARAQAAITAMRNLDAMMRMPVENGGVKGGGSIAAGSLEFRDVTFTYPEAPLTALRGVSFRIAPGERVGLLGPVGSGKSTLGKLAAGLWDVQSGSILAGGIESRSLDAAELRAAIGLMGQEVELFSGTLYDNLVMGVRAPDEAQLAAACDVAGVTAFAARNPLGLRLPVGERGRALSGGQRQAVALARALLRAPRVLILDEPSSALDSASEADLVRRMKAWASARGTTLLISSQRLAMLELCERVLVLDQGQLVADGPKSEILKRLAQPAAPIPRAG